MTEGLRASERVATFRDVNGRRHFLRVERNFLYDIEGSQYLPVGIIHIDPKTKCVLVELPQEAETGANRLWINENQLDEPVEVYS